MLPSCTDIRFLTSSFRWTDVVSPFTPTVDELLPPLTTQQELALLARVLWREGWNDHLAGHITINRGDGTLWCNPWLLQWNELRPEHIIAVDLDGNVVEGDWPAPLGLPLHLALHRARPDVQVTVHSHPQFATVWAARRELPAVLDQSGALGGGELVLVDEYSGTVDSGDAAHDAVEALGDADLALLAGHGALVIGSSVRAAHQRAVALEHRSRLAWRVAAASTGVGDGAGDGVASALPEPIQRRMRQSDGTRFIGFWEAAVRGELIADPTLLGPPR